VYMRAMSENRLGSSVPIQTGKAPGDAFWLARASKDVAQTDALETTLADGKAVFRWPSEPGIKLERIDIYSDGEVVNEFREQSAIEFRARLRCEADQDLACRYQITIFTLDSRRITRIRSETDSFRARPGVLRDVTMTLNPCLLGAGRYYISFAVLTSDERDIGVPQGRYDLVARFLDFEIYRTLDYRDAAVFFHDAKWQIGQRDDIGEDKGEDAVAPATARRIASGQ
ncbi:MAG: Wzt carbohydrate-binding domain-containing protein, partial [Pseudolabrys sp.]